ncbi:uncharacterized protein BXIN_1697 [Babesia sp. Xinjiang]|uniref:uncharacterized protein n=1 Tax=Babesia sp. Xinjiang TaxID=462227 RepID=UPI000A233992|nr:uncharacterized protein BXIN_1725 [Babesia sp. Xinjiang]XP_028871419.1 uncharacterized protein BXIN_1697 [Babesia sp. Xinjiang]ORM40864.1 hypothetical protein BXIN_1725 [Babesia sp. Xinjiang]ORM40963.1 hypothetical protein BXIN_1697 [Babesia sp. Xinjiang]
MDTPKTLSGLHLAACIVRRDFHGICPSYSVRGVDSQPRKKAKRDTNIEEQVLYRPFNDDNEALHRYLSVSPRAVEVFDLLGSGDANAQRPGLALLWFILSRCSNEETRQQVADHVLTRLCEQMPELIALGDTALHYLLNIVLECVRIAPVEKIRVFLSTFGFYKFFGKQSVPKAKCNAFSVAAFHSFLVENGLIEDLGLCEFLPKDSNLFGDVTDLVELCYANHKKQLCILLLLGLKGFNIIDQTYIVRQVFAHVKHDGFMDSICTIRLFIIAMSNFMTTQYPRLAFTIRDTKWSDVPHSVISSTATALSHAIGHVTETQEKDQERIVRLTRIIVDMCSEFIDNLHSISDVSTMATVLNIFDPAQLVTGEIVSPILKQNRALGPLYMSSMKCKYNGDLEYVALLKFLTTWFEHTSTLAVTPDDCLLYIPPVLTPSFFNAGLLSGDESTSRGALRMLAALMRYLIASAAQGSRSIASTTISERLYDIIPDFKTLVNAKTALSRKQKVEKDNLSINIKNETRSMVSTELGAVVTGDSKKHILGIDETVEPITDWLDCLYLYSTVVGIGDGKSLYDPCKLLKEDVIIKNANTLTSAINDKNEGHMDTSKLACSIKLGISLANCLFCLGIGEIHSGVALTKVQNICFQYILRRYVELKSAMEQHKWDLNLLFDYQERCKSCVRYVIENSGVFPKEVDSWISGIKTESDIHVFHLLFNYCTETPLDALFGCLSAKPADNPAVNFKCLNCFTAKEFKGPLFMRASLDFLLHLSSQDADQLQCDDCGTRQMNLVKEFTKRGSEASVDPAIAAEYILRVCTQANTGVSSGCVKRVIHAVLSKHDLKLEKKTVRRGRKRKRATKSRLDCATTTTSAVPTVVDNKYLMGCSSSINAIESFNQDVLALKELGNITIDVLIARLSQSPEHILAVKEEWASEQQRPVLIKLINMGILRLYTNLFSIMAALLDSDDVTIVTPDEFKEVEFDDDLRWAQLYYLQRRFSLECEVSGTISMVQDRMLAMLSEICADADTDDELKTAMALTISKLCTMIPPSAVEYDAPELLVGVMKSVRLPIECNKCDDVLSCEFGYAKYMLDIASYLASAIPTSDLTIAYELLQSPQMLEMTEAICELNSHQHFTGDTIEAYLFLSFVTFMMSLIRHICNVDADMTKIDREIICRLLEAVAGCYRCSYSDSDLVVRDIIMALVRTLGGLMEDPKSVCMKLPPFKDFACISELSCHADSSISDKDVSGALGSTRTKQYGRRTINHGVSRGWIKMKSGFAMVSASSNWLCLNNKRVSMTLLSFPAGGSADRGNLKDTYRIISIMWPPTTPQASDRSDTVLRAITRLDKILSNHSKYLEQLVVGDPYIYDTTYLIPFILGRLCAMLYDQLYQYKQELNSAFESMGALHGNTDEAAPNRFIKFFSLPEAKAAAKRLYEQMQSFKFDFAIGEVFSPLFMEQVVRNGVVEICTLGLLSADTRKDSIKALGIITKLIQNMMDATIVRSVVPGKDGPYKLRRVGLFGIHQVHAVLFFIQRCLLYTDTGDPALPMLIASQMFRHVIKPEDPLYQLGNKYFISKFQPSMGEVPLFFECFNVQGVTERIHFLSFILQVLLGSAFLLNDCKTLFRRRVLQQLLSFALVDTTRCEHRIQICAFLHRCVLRHSTIITELYSIGTATWASAMSLLLRSSNFTEAKDVVLSTVLLCSLTSLVRSLGLAICDQFSSASGTADAVESQEHSFPTLNGGNDADGEVALPKSNNLIDTMDSNVRYVIATLEALQRIAEAWCYLIGHVPKEKIQRLQFEGYRIYSLAMKEVLFALRQTVMAPNVCSDVTISNLLLTAVEMAESAIGRATSIMSNP